MRESCGKADSLHIEWVYKQEWDMME